MEGLHGCMRRNSDSLKEPRQNPDGQPARKRTTQFYNHKELNLVKNLEADSSIDPLGTGPAL